MRKTESEHNSFKIILTLKYMYIDSPECSHGRTGHRDKGGCRTHPPPLPKRKKNKRLGQLRFFGQQENFGKKYFNMFYEVIWIMYVGLC